MRRGLVAYTALAFVGLGLTGCGLNRFEQREPWRDQAEASCLAQKMVQPTAYMSASSAISGPGACGMNNPFRITAFGGGSVGLARPVTLACPVIPRIDAWLNEVVQPAAALYYGQRVTEVRSGSYACRSRNNQRGARLSEHSFGNAVDVMAFRLADGREIPVARGWRGEEADQEFLREVFVGACQYFTTVLGPGSDMFHYDHFHLDLARHDPRGERRICKPMLKFTPRLGAGAGAAAPAPRPPLPDGGGVEGPDQPYEPEEEDDPFAAPMSARESGMRLSERRSSPGAASLERRPAPAPAYAETRRPLPAGDVPLPPSRYGALDRAGRSDPMPLSPRVSVSGPIY